MTRPRGGLGRGLASLIPAGPDSPVASVIIAPLVSRETTPPREDSRNGHDSRNGSAENNESVSRETTTAPSAVQEPVAATPIQSVDTQQPHYREVPVGSIVPNPHNPRTAFDEEALAELEHSIREFGMLQPVVVRERPGGFELVMGERRWRAAQRAGLTLIPAIVRRTEDADLLRDALLENIHRANLNPLEEAAAYQQLLEEFNVTHDELATRLGRSRPVISNTIRLLKLPVPVQRRVAAGVLSAGHARALLALDQPSAQEDLAARIVAEGLSVRGTEEAVTLLVGRGSGTTRRTPVRRTVTPGIEELARRLGDRLDTRVLVELGRRKGRIVIEFATTDDLSRIADVIEGRAAARDSEGTRIA
jgi:ParB family chromosome partitioning protein